MSRNITFNIYVMSYKRSHRIMTQNLFEYCTYVVREEEAQRYKDSGIKSVLSIPKGTVNDFMSTFYWIIENTPEDVICIIDDDVKEMMYRQDETISIRNKDKSFDTETATAECERIAQIVYDLGIGLASDPCTLTPYNYTQEFKFFGIPGHMRFVNKEKFAAKYNPDDPACSDIDMVMQELLYNRVVLFPMYYCTHAEMDTNEGMCNARKAHNDLQYAMMNKWGEFYDYDFKKNIAKINVKR